jgi:hypothetical protein
LADSLLWKIKFPRFIFFEFNYFLSFWLPNRRPIPSFFGRLEQVHFLLDRGLVSFGKPFGFDSLLFFPLSNTELQTGDHTPFLPSSFPYLARFFSLHHCYFVLALSSEQYIDTLKIILFILGDGEMLVMVIVGFLFQFLMHFNLSVAQSGWQNTSVLVSKYYNIFFIIRPVWFISYTI